MYSSWIAAVPLLFFSTIAGALSDVFGRKPLILFPLIGYLLSSIFNTVNYAFIKVLPVEFFYLDKVNSLFGGFSIFLLGIYAYGTSVTKPDERAYRLTRFNVVKYISLSPLTLKISSNLATQHNSTQRVGS
jgi:MFS family permease